MPADRNSHATAMPRPSCIFKTENNGKCFAVIGATSIQSQQQEPVLTQ
ncbi:MAG: hypothetical protein HXL35_03910 [Prevotellaceae bacterium]|nr:hypothetical protein [Prevotellaceae bacterium]